MDHPRLRFLAGILSEERSAVDDFKGISSVVNDAIADLTDKLGQGGSLEEMMKREGLDKHDTIKDQDGKLILERLAIRTSQYAEEVKKLFTEIEFIIEMRTKKN